MSNPQRPGWYPAPDGTSTEQWWNGAAWSDTKRGIGGASMPGLPGYQATPPAYGPSSNGPGLSTPPAPYVMRPPPGTNAMTLQQAGMSGRAVTATRQTPLIGLILGIVSIFTFPPIGIAAIVLGVLALRRPETVGAQRAMAIGAILTGITALLWGAISLVILIVGLGALDAAPPS